MFIAHLLRAMQNVRLKVLQNVVLAFKKLTIKKEVKYLYVSLNRENNESIMNDAS